MSRILLVHWNQDEARERARKLTALGHGVEILSTSENSELRKVRSSPPELFLIDLGRLPSHGREIAAYFRRQKATRTVPIVFVGEDRERVEQARRLLPDAHFAQWTNVRATIRKARRHALADPVVPGTMDAYSASPLPKKLGIRENYGVALCNAPKDFERRLEPWPEGAEIIPDPSHANVAILFVASQAELARDLRPGSKILLLMPESLQVRLGIQGFGVSGSFAKWGLAWPFRILRDRVPHSERPCAK